MSLYADLIGTTRTTFRLGIGTAARLIKVVSGNFSFRNAADSADVEITASKLNASGDSITLNSDAADTGSDRSLTLARNAAASQSYSLVTPPAKGTDGFVLRQKAGTAAGVLELELAAPGAGASGSSMLDTTSLGFGSSASGSMFQLPANSEAERVRLVIDTPFNGTPSVSVGIAGTTSKYAAATDIDLTAAAGTVFEIHPGLAPAGTAEDLIFTYAAGGATAGAARILVHYGIPT